ncbi:MAG: PSD1 domain-containing protein [Planctomycetaceae bacterium]|nr:PSD1 domain-containing protein [Planctomycetales bacterium]MCB9872920.1 PSD1 domain-containing protein [Planctomycetaceae bacterium]
MSQTLHTFVSGVGVIFCLLPLRSLAGEDIEGADFFERRVRPILVKYCYECHSEEAGEQQGGLLLDRQTGWLKGGEAGVAVLPGEPEASLLITAVRYNNEYLQMPPEEPLDAAQVKLLEQWVSRGAPGPRQDLGDTEFSRLGDQGYLFGQATGHWSFQPVVSREPPSVADKSWNLHAIDRFIYDRLQREQLTPSRPADPRTLARRVTYDLTGLPPTATALDAFACEKDRQAAIESLVEELLNSQAFGEHIGRLWLDVARYADTDSFYRPDTKTPHYFPFAFTYRDYVIAAFNMDKPFDQFIREQFAADLMDFSPDAPEIAALGFLAVGPHANRDQAEAIDDWIDVTTRGLMGVTAACARCHDHKYEPIPTTDYYALHGVFSSITRIDPIDDTKQPLIAGYEASEQEKADYIDKRAAINEKIDGAGGKKATNNNRSIADKIRETELAELLLFHAGAPTHSMVVRERPRPVEPVVFLRGEPSMRGEAVSRRFLTILDPTNTPFPKSTSGRLQLAEKIVDPSNPLTARVFVNRVWGMLIGSYLVDTPSDFGLQGSDPTHPELLDWLAADFVSHGWSVKRLVTQIVTSRTYQQSSSHREDMAAVDPQNLLLWRANRKHLAIEAIRDSMLAVAGQLDRTPRGRPAELWGDNYTRRRAIYGFVNRFNLDPTLRAFDFPTPMQTQPRRDESIVAPQALFTMNSPFVIDQAVAITDSVEFQKHVSDEARVRHLFTRVLQRQPDALEIMRVSRFVESQTRFYTEPPKRASRVTSPWPLAAQALLMSNEFLYID